MEKNKPKQKKKVDIQSNTQSNTQSNIQSNIQSNTEPTPTIFDKYRHYIKQANSNYISGIKYNEIMEIHRYCERTLKKQLSLDTSCGYCVLNRIKQFASLEK